MPLANFIDRAATSASQLLGGFQPTAFLTRLEEQVIGFGFDAEALASPEGRAPLDLLVRLLARRFLVSASPGLMATIIGQTQS